ncbi:MAG TPA: VOC family protein [Planctomycetota bacterium]|nr:VOC family protein [Planctomycetota bacterium]
MAARSARRGGLRAPALTHLAIPVRDVGRSLRFYRGTLGMTVAWREPGMVDLRAGPWADGFDLTLSEAPRADGRSSPIHFGWRLPSAREVGRWEARLRSAGVTIEARRRERDGGTGIYFRDPDGYELEVYAEGE